MIDNKVSQMSPLYKKVLIATIIATILFTLCARESFCDDYRQAAGLIDLRTTFSDGAYSITELVKMAKERGFEVVITNDHDRMVMEYGLPPFRNLLKKKVERPSINEKGAESYLDSINRVRGKYPGMIIIPGSETSAYYYWTGSYLKDNLTAHDHEKRILTIGMETPGDYENLPILHNGFSSEYTSAVVFSLWMLVSLIIIAASIFLLRRRGFLRITGVVSLILGIGFAFNSNPFRSSPFDQYQGYQGIAPYQLLIDYVNSRGGLTFWNYPETRSGIRKLGPINVKTPPHPEVLEESEGYTGFAALYGDNITVTEPGKVWDRILIQYCNGVRNRPVWGISTADYHEEGSAGEKLGNFATVFLLREKSVKGVMEALKGGKIYAYRGRYPQLVRLDEFSVCYSDGKVAGISGDEITLKDNPRIRISISASEIPKNKVTLRLMRSGKLIGTFEETLPLHIDYEDKYYSPGKKIFYRIDMNGYGTLISNPIFVKFEG
ncbi:MAG: hypothetical protein JXB42_08040 [Deltaproteobacteria bacterium]|nr:hypothetical protein [Deltaproteobacteria bacterium]